MTRIVSLLPAATEMICGIGLREQLVGVSHECNWPLGLDALPRVTRSRVDSSVDSAAIDAQVKQLAASGESFYEIDADQIAAMRPTLIVTQGECCDVCAVSLSAVEELVAERPELAGTPIVSLAPKSLAEVFADIERIGVTAGANAAAVEYAHSLRQRVDAIRAATKNATKQPLATKRRVVIIEWIEPLMAAGNWTPELVDIAGGDYGLATAGRPSPYVAWEEILAFQPEVLIVAPCGFDLERSEREAQRLTRLPGWNQLPAVVRKNASVINGNAYLNRPGPRLVESLELLHQLLAVPAFAGHPASRSLA